MKSTHDIIIIGGGIIGLSVAYQLLQEHPDVKIAVLEKESAPSLHQTGHNSGVIHAGVYYAPGSLKAKFCYEGNRLTKSFCDEHQIPFKNIGKLIVATNELELNRMQQLIERCQKNNLRFETLNQNETVKKQPGLSAVGSIFIPDAGIVSWTNVAQKYTELFRALGGTIYFNQELTDINEANHSISLTTKLQKFQCDYLITCGGLYSDRLVKMSKLKPTFKIIPFRGEYYQLSDHYSEIFNHLIYPVPDPALPFLGVHFTPQIEGHVTVGPNAVLALAREGYSWGAWNVKDAAEILSYRPLWKLIGKNLSATMNELRSSFSKSYYLKLLQQYFPTLKRDDLLPYRAGVRAQAVDESGNFIHDFLFVESERILHTCNAPSPAATSSLPIGKYIVERFSEKFKSH